MRIIGDTSIDFMSRRNIWLTVSAVVVLAAIAVLFTKGIKQGVEFTGGAQVILRYVEAPALDDIRARLTGAGLEGVSVTTSELERTPTEELANPEGQDLIIRLALPERPLDDGEQGEIATIDLTRRIAEVLRPEEVATRLSQGMLDVNTSDQTALAGLIFSESQSDRESAEADAAAVLEWRKNHGGVFASVDQLDKVDGLSDEGRAFLKERTFAGPFGLRGQELIDASVSGEMRSKAMWAILGALGGMLIYIWVRFQLQWGLAAIAALVHDTLITLGAFAIAGMEANLPVVAAFLTLVGYSVNDTIVVFDRIRENLRTRGEGKLTEVINLSINQNLSRTLITSLTTWLVVLSLFVFGGLVIRPFAFVLLIGILVGTYSSIYIASPVLLLWQKIRGGEVLSTKAKSGGSKKRTGSPARAAR